MTYRLSPSRIILLCLLVGAFVFATTPVAHAAGTVHGDDKATVTEICTTLSCKLFEKVLSAFQEMAGWGLYAAGTALNYSAYVSIVKMGSFVNSSGAVSVAWGVLRDVGNLILVFGFIAIGISTILDIEQYAAKRLLVYLLIVAVAMNFSSLIARAVIDTGNIVALQFYKEMNDGNLPKGELTDNGISNQFMKYTKLSNLYSAKDFTAEQKQKLGDNAVFIFLLSILLYIVSIFVFLFIAIVFLSRFVILTLLITISALAFAAMAVPRFQGLAKKWWGTLINQTLVAPLLMLMLLISMRMLGDPFFLSMSTGSYGNLQAPTWASLVIAFSLICGFFIASVILAKQLGAFGADFAMGATSKIMKTAGKGVALPFVPATRLAQRGAGALSKKYEGSGLARTLAKSSILSPLDDVIKGGFNKATSAKPLGLNSYKEKKEAMEHRGHELNTVLAKANLDAEMKEIKDPGHPRKELSAQSKDIYQRMSTKDLLQMKGVKDGEASFIENLTQAQYDNLMGDPEADLGVKQHISDARSAMFSSVMVPGRIPPGSPPGTVVPPVSRAKYELTAPGMTGPQILKKVPKAVWSDPVKAAVVLAALPGKKLIEMNPAQMEPEALSAISEYFSTGGAGYGGAAHTELMGRVVGNPKLEDKWLAHINP